MAKAAKTSAKSDASKKLTKKKAQAVVYKVIEDNFPGADPSPDQPLKQYGYTDGPKLIGLRDDIYGACDVYINAKDIVKCKTVGDVIDLLTDQA
jgi:hypothetical protein